MDDRPFVAIKFDQDCVASLASSRASAFPLGEDVARATLVPELRGQAFLELRVASHFSPAGRETGRHIKIIRLFWAILES